MLYFSICILVCFVIYCIYKPEITIVHKHFHYDSVEEQRLNYQRECDAQLAKLTQEQQKKELERLEKEVDSTKQIENMLDDINSFMRGE